MVSGAQVRRAGMMDQRTGPRLLTQAVVGIGNGGRGVVVRGTRLTNYVITAAHCMPEDYHRNQLPSPHLANGPELIIPAFIGKATSEDRPVYARLICYSLVDDIAVFDEPETYDELDEDYANLTNEAAMYASALPRRSYPDARWPDVQWPEMPDLPGYVLSLDREWQPCTVRCDGRVLLLGGAKIEGGMSGSPILNTDGAVIGVISTGDTNMNMHPALACCLPPWLWQRLKKRR
jgi:hypothetical protein